MTKRCCIRSSAPILAAALLLSASGGAAAQDAAGEAGGTAAQSPAPSSVYRVKVDVSYPGSTPQVQEVAQDVSAAPDSAPTEIIAPFAPLVDIAPRSGSAPEDDAPVVSEPRKILASLGGEPITEEDLRRELWRRHGRETFEWLVGRAILRRELDALGIDIRDREISDRLELHLADLRRAFPGLTIPDELTRASSGLPLEEYRERTVWAELALRKIMRAKSRPTDEQLRRYYAEIQSGFIRPARVRVSQVFIPPEPGPESGGIASPEDWRRAELQILEADSRLRMKEDFADIARAYGTGGRLSRWVRRGELLRELEDYAFSILPGAITTPIRTSMGYHILTVEEKEERLDPAFEEVRNEVLERYREAEFLMTAGRFMEDLKAAALADGTLDLSGAEEAFGETDAK